MDQRDLLGSLNFATSLKRQWMAREFSEFNKKQLSCGSTARERIDVGTETMICFVSLLHDRKAAMLCEGWSLRAWNIQSEIEI